MKQLLSVMKFEFSSFAKNKAFITVAIISFLVSLIGPLVPAIIDRVEIDGFGAERSIAVVDNSGVINSEILAAFISTPATIFDDINSAITAVENGDYNYALEILDGDAALHVVTMGFGIANTQSQVAAMLRHIYLETELSLYGISEARTQEILSFRPMVELLPIGDDGYTTMDTFVENFFYSYAMSFLLYFALLLGSGHLLTTVVREKSTKTMELLVTSCPPRTMMNGKVLGVGMAILVQVSAMVVAVICSMQLARVLFPDTDAFTISVSVPLLGLLILFFLLGFMMFSYIYAALASTTSRMEDAQSLSQIPQMLIIAGFFMSIFGMQNPGAGWVQIASHVPFFAPFIMFGRAVLGTAAVWEVVLSIVVQVVTIVIVAWMAAKIYRMGTLMYGAKPTLKNLLEAFK